MRALLAQCERDKAASRNVARPIIDPHINRITNRCIQSAVSEIGQALHHILQWKSARQIANCQSGCERQPLLAQSGPDILSIFASRACPFERCACLAAFQQISQFALTVQSACQKRRVLARSIQCSLPLIRHWLHLPADPPPCKYARKYGAQVGCAKHDLYAKTHRIDEREGNSVHDETCLEKPMGWRRRIGAGCMRRHGGRRRCSRSARHTRSGR